MIMTFDHNIYIYIYLLNESVPLPAAYLTWNEEDEIGTLNYGKQYLKRNNAIALDPINLPLTEKPLICKINEGIPGAVRDAMPDYWGQLMIASTIGRPFDEITPIEYLLHTCDDRIGALEFRPELSSPKLDEKYNKLINLEELIHQLEQLSKGKIVPDWFQDYIKRGSSAGGAKPKLTVEYQDALYIAKFNLKSQKYTEFNSATRVEFATMKLAEYAGINTAEVKLIEQNDHEVLLIKRFDRIKVNDYYQH